MWIFFSNSMLSIVDKGGDGSTLLVRARRQEDMTRIFPQAQVQVGGGTDYLYRARIDREEVATTRSACPAHRAPSTPAPHPRSRAEATGRRSVRSAR